MVSDFIYCHTASLKYFYILPEGFKVGGVPSLAILNPNCAAARLIESGCTSTLKAIEKRGSSFSASDGM
jgi:hypothetical protein